MGEIRHFLCHYILELHHKFYLCTVFGRWGKLDRTHCYLWIIEIKFILKKWLPLHNLSRYASEKERLSKLILNHKVKYCQIVNFLRKNKTFPLIEQIAWEFYMHIIIELFEIKRKVGPFSIHIFGEPLGKTLAYEWCLRVVQINQDCPIMEAKFRVYVTKLVLVDLFEPSHVHQYIDIQQVKW